MSSTATHADAELILKLYDARREAELRKARNWWVQTFWPQSADDILAVMRAAGTLENNWFRQVLGYWGIAISFVQHGVLNQALFLEQAFCGELFFVYAKIAPYLKELREKTQNPNFLVNAEALILSEVAKPRLEAVTRNVENARKARLQAKGN
jgi:hypothetical protein